MESKMGMRQDFDRKEEEPVEAAPAAAPPPAAEPGYMAELERQAQLRDQGILREEEFEAKRRSRSWGYEPSSCQASETDGRQSAAIRRKLFSEVARPKRRDYLDPEDTRV